MDASTRVETRTMKHLASDSANPERWMVSFAIDPNGADETHITVYVPGTSEKSIKSVHEEAQAQLQRVRSASPTAMREEVQPEPKPATERAWHWQDNLRRGVNSPL